MAPGQRTRDSTDNRGSLEDDGGLLKQTREFEFTRGFTHSWTGLVPTWPSALEDDGSLAPVAADDQLQQLPNRYPPMGTQTYLSGYNLKEQFGLHSPSLFYKVKQKSKWDDRSPYTTKSPLVVSMGQPYQKRFPRIGLRYNPAMPKESLGCCSTGPKYYVQPPNIWNLPPVERTGPMRFR